MYIGLIYAINCKETGKFYIGSTTQKNNQRFNEHRSKLNRDKHDNQHLQNAWNKYGEDNFEFLVIEKCNNVLKREQYYIDITGCWDKNIGFNKQRYVANAVGKRQWTDEERLAASKRRKGMVSNMKDKKHPNHKPILEAAIKSNQKRVRCIEMDYIYPSVTHAAFCHRRNAATLTGALKGNGRCAGFTWEYVKEGDI